MFFNKFRTAIRKSPNFPSNPEVAVYFAGKITHIYQIKQWVSVFKALSEKHTFIIIAREKLTFKWICKNTDILVIFLSKRLTSLQSYYHLTPSLKCILYVNNSIKNFQSLIHCKTMHVHINHGESEKISTTSNQVKSYDRVFIVAERAYKKYESALLECNANLFVKIGRPQIDHVENIQKTNKGRKVILYAPTWEGSFSSMNYSSVPYFGERITESILNDPNYYLIYRPHPQTGRLNPETNQANKRIKKMVAKHPFAELDESSDSLALSKLCDLAILDNSAMAVDHLKWGTPMFITSLPNKKEAATFKARIIDSAISLNQDNIDDLIQLIKQEIQQDTLKEIRNQVKFEFLGNYKEGESTQKFISEITKIIVLRDELMKIKEENISHV